jgi:hypothetical protein
MNNMNEFVKSLEEEIYSKVEIEMNLCNLLKEKTQFLEMVKNHQEKLDENILSLSKIQKNNENLIKNNVPRNDKYNCQINKRKS